MNVTLLAILLGILLLDEEHTSKEQDSATVTGTITYPQHIALPQGTMKVQVQLADISKQDVASVVLGEQITTLEQQVPIPFVVAYNPKDIISTHRYAIQVRITGQEGKLWFTTTSVHQVITNGYPLSNVEITLQMVR